MSTKTDIFKNLINDIIDENLSINTLKTDVAVLKTDVAVLKTDVAGLKTDVAQLKTDVAQLKTDVAQLKTDVAQLKTDVAQLKTDVAGLKSDMIIVKTDIAKLYEGQLYLGGMMEDMKHTLGLVLDAVIPARERATLVEDVVAKVDDHEYRISAVESHLKAPRS